VGTGINRDDVIEGIVLKSVPGKVKYDDSWLVATFDSFLQCRYIVIDLTPTRVIAQYRIKSQLFESVGDLFGIVLSVEHMVKVLIVLRSKDKCQARNRLRRR